MWFQQAWILGNVQKIVIPDVKKPKIDQGIMLDGSLLNNSRPIIKPIDCLLYTSNFKDA